MGRCRHKKVLATVNAGLERLVCEECGHVSVRFIAETVQVYADLTDRAATRRQPTCGRCDERAVFMIPSGLACAGHAWAAAARQDALGGELWIPIKFDQTSNAPG